MSALSPTAQTIGSVELYLEYGGGLEFLPGGDLKLARDDDGSYTATRQRLERLIFTTPIQTDVNGLPIGPPDDRFNPNWGAGLPALVGENYTAALETEITRRILTGLQGDPGLDPTATPTVSVTPIGVAQFLVQVSVTTASGAPFTFPAVLVPPTGG
jgi:hypothetical protein